MRVGELKAALERYDEDRWVTFDPGKAGKEALCNDSAWTLAVDSVGEDRESNVELRGYEGDPDAEGGPERS